MDWFNLSLKEISNLNDKNIFKEILENINSLDKRLANKINIYKVYLQQLKQVLNNDFSNLDLYITFEMIYKEYEQLSVKNTSRLFFNDHLVILYPKTKLYKASNMITCCFSNEIIKPNGYYIYYRPLLDDVTTKKTYIVTPTIKVSPYYEEFLPKNILELEDFQRKLLNAYNNEGDDRINYYDVSTNLKVDSFTLHLLKKS